MATSKIGFGTKVAVFNKTMRKC